MFLNGYAPSQDDKDLFNKFAYNHAEIKVNEHPFTYSWYLLVSKFSNRVKNKWNVSEQKQIKVTSDLN